jgi:hypothetical protein
VYSLVSDTVCFQGLYSYNVYIIHGNKKRRKRIEKQMHLLCLQIYDRRLKVRRFFRVLIIRTLHILETISEHHYKLQQQATVRGAATHIHHQ